MASLSTASLGIIVLKGHRNPTFLSANLKTTVYPGVFAGIYFREFLSVAKIIKIISQILGATPSSRSALTCFGLIAKIAPVSDSRKYYRYATSVVRV